MGKYANTCAKYEISGINYVARSAVNRQQMTLLDDTNDNIAW